MYDLFYLKKEVQDMNLNLRNAIRHNIQDNGKDQLELTIKDAIQSGEEKMLPGLGVMFEIIWQNSNPQDQKEMLDSLSQGLK